MADTTTQARPKAGKKGMKQDSSQGSSTTDAPTTPLATTETAQTDDAGDGEIQVNGNSESSNDSAYIRELQKSAIPITIWSYYRY